MAVVKCPSCGTTINVVEKKTGLWWGLGCLVAVFVLPVIVIVLGLVSAIAIPSFVKARESSQQAVCSSNLKMLDAAKAQILVEKDYKPGDLIPDREVKTHLPQGLDGLRCPKGGRYILNPAGKDPACSVHGPLARDAPERSGSFDTAVER